MSKMSNVALAGQTFPECDHSMIEYERDMAFDLLATIESITNDRIACSDGTALSLIGKLVAAFRKSVENCIDNPDGK